MKSTEKKQLPLISNFTNWLKGWVILCAFSMTLMTLWRGVWYFSYRKGDELTHYSKDLLNAFILGARFDFSAFSYLTLLSLIIWIPFFVTSSPRLKGKVYFIQRQFWSIMLCFLALIYVADYTFYSFFQDHFNALIFGFIQDDTYALIRTIWKNYPVVKILATLFLTYFVIHKLLKTLWFNSYTPIEKLSENEIENISSPKTSSTWNTFILYILTFFSVSLGARGTLGLFPLEIMHTSISSHNFINTLCFNSAHALVHAIQLYDQQHQSWNENLKQLGYNENYIQALRDFTNETKNNSEIYFQVTAKKKSLDQPLPHVVVILMESWGSDWIMQKEVDLLGPLKNHLQQDLFTPWMMPSHVATIGSLGSLIVDLPHRFFSPFLTESQYINVQFTHSPARIFKEKGYKTHFIYGGNLGWRGLGPFLPKQGFQYLHGDHEILKFFENEDSNKEKEHDWGIYDEFVFDYAYKILEQAKTPQFIFILTTSNHPPYTVPSHFNPNSIKLSNTLKGNIIGDIKMAEDRLKVYEYANHQLGIFLDKIKMPNQITNQNLANHTIVAATGDHSFYIKSYDNLALFEKWSVPFYLYLPKWLRPSNNSYSNSSNHSLNDSSTHSYINSSFLRPISDESIILPITIASHIDIFPTLYNLIFSELKYFSLGQNLLDKNKKPWAFHTPSKSVFEESIGLLLKSNGETLNTICKSEKNKITYVPCPSTPQHETLRKKLTGMMGYADFVFKTETQTSSESKDIHE